MRTLAGPNTNALRSITGYNVGSPLRKMPAMTQGQAGGAAAGAAALGSDIGAIASGNIAAQGAKGEGGRILGETAKYAGMGMAFGPIGAAVGAAVGLTVGLVKNKKAKEAYKVQQTEIADAKAAGNARAALAANVNSQNNANNEQMANNKPGIKRTLSSLGYNSSNNKKSSMEYNQSEMMRTVSGASSLQKAGVDPETGVFYDGETATKNKQGKRTLISETNQSTVTDDGSEKFDKTYKAQTQKKNKALDARAAREKAKADAAKAAALKEETEKANKRAKVNAKADQKN